MNKILFFISSIALVACAGGSFQNDTSETVKVGDTELSSGACEAFGGGFLGFGSDFPLTVTKNDEASTLNITDGEDLESGHYVIQADGTVVSSETSCEDEEEAEAEAEEEAEAEDNNSDDDSTAESEEETDDEGPLDKLKSNQ